MTDQIPAIEELVKMAESIKDSQPKQFLLISPDGTLYKGSATQLTPILLQYHLEGTENTNDQPL